MDAVRLLDVALSLGATARLTRFVTTDDLGGMLVREPVHRWADTHPRRARLAEGVECPWCVSEWAAMLVLLGYSTERLRGPWRFLAGSLTLSYLTGYLETHGD